MTRSTRTLSRMCTTIACLSLCAAIAAQSPEPLIPLRPTPTGDLPYFIGAGLEPSEPRPGDNELIEWALAAWQRRSNGLLRFTPSDEQNAVIGIYWLPFASGGIIGQTARALYRQGAVASIFLRPDTEPMGGTIAARVREDPLFRDTLVYFVALHEIGHALGIPHSLRRGEIMSAGGHGGELDVLEQRRSSFTTREALATADWLSEADIAPLARLYAR